VSLFGSIGLTSRLDFLEKRDYHQKYGEAIDGIFSGQQNTAYQRLDTRPGNPL
jgi:hypothetical protein